MFSIQVINQLSYQCKCTNVVDVGAGQGHLSRLLAFMYKLKVTTVEAVGCHAPKAEKIDRYMVDVNFTLMSIIWKWCTLVLP